MLQYHTDAFDFKTDPVCGDIDDFVECCEHHRYFMDLGILALPIAADNLQWLAERWGLIDIYGQDEIQRIMARAFTGGETP